LAQQLFTQANPKATQGATKDVIQQFYFVLQALELSVNGIGTNPVDHRTCGQVRQSRVPPQ
jgi:hypothetical protein